MTDLLPYKQYCLNKYDQTPTLDLINRKLLIHKQLEKPPRTYVVYSDLHGSYQKYLHWLKNGLGYYQIVVDKVLGPSYSRQITKTYERMLYMINRSRFDAIEASIIHNEQNFDHRAHFSAPVPKEFMELLTQLEEHGLARRRVLLDVLAILREVTRGDERRIIKVLPTDYIENILKLFHQDDSESFAGLVEGIVSSKTIFSYMTSLLLRLVVYNVFEKHINLGDTFDRGEDADYLMRLYRLYFGDFASDSPLHYIWGNHDILWMGAAVGNPVLAVEAIRISLRYQNVAFLERYGFDLSCLDTLVEQCYKLSPLGSYAKKSTGCNQSAEKTAQIAKALMVIQTKLAHNLLKACHSSTDQVGEGEIDVTEELQRHSELLSKLATGISHDQGQLEDFLRANPLYRDGYFPTIDATDPGQLTPEEQQVVDSLCQQFKNLKQLQDDMHWMFSRGEAYRVADNTLFFHAALPASPTGQLETFAGFRGKNLLDYVQTHLKELGEKHFSGADLDEKDLMFFWHLWCGRHSPFFCKRKMATVERAVFHKEVASDSPLTSHTEESNPFYRHIRDDGFLTRMLSEFHAKRLCLGHTPVKTMRQAVLSDAIRAFIVDGGASAAYGDRGAVLINTPDFAYLTFHPSLEDLKAAESANELPGITLKRLEERSGHRLRHMEKGYYLERELEAIDLLLDTRLDSFAQEYFL